MSTVHHDRLIHNMKQRRIPSQIVKLVESFLTERTTQLRFNGTTSADIKIEARIPQGSPLSPILFMLYNAELVEIPKAPDLALGFIDDIVYGISGLTAQGNIERLQVILSKSEEWKENTVHNSSQINTCSSTSRATQDSTPRLASNCKGRESGRSRGSDLQAVQATMNRNNENISPLHGVDEG